MNVVEVRTYEGRDVLTLNTGLTPRAFGQSTMSNLLEEHGLLLDQAGNLSEWIPDGTFCDTIDSKETIFIYGPAFSGTPLLTTITGEKELAWKKLHQSIAIIHKIFVTQKLPIEVLTNIAGAGPEAILSNDDDRVLILPSVIYNRCVASQGDSVETENRFRWIHPDYLTLNPSHAFGFLAGTLAYRIIAGFPPFSIPVEMYKSKQETTNASEIIAHVIRTGYFEPTELAVWNIRPAAAKCINELISAKIAASADTLLAFGDSLSDIQDATKNELAESTAFHTAKETAAKKRAAKYKREQFIHKYRTVMLVAAAVIVIGAVVIGSTVKSNQERPSTLGMTPLEVVDGYYKAISVLDQDIPETYLAKKTKSPYVNLTTNLYVTSKMQEAYTPNSGVLSPAGLFALNGNPGNHMIYGITGLKIKNENATDTSAAFTVSFYMWTPSAEDTASSVESAPPSSEDTDTTTPLSVYFYVDHVTLTYIKDRWKINALEEQECTVIENDKTKLLSEIAAGTANALPYAPTPEEISAAQKAIQHPTL